MPTIFKIGSITSRCFGSLLAGGNLYFVRAIGRMEEWQSEGEGGRGEKPRCMSHSSQIFRLLAVQYGDRNTHYRLQAGYCFGKGARALWKSGNSHISTTSEPVWSPLSTERHLSLLQLSVELKTKIDFHGKKSNKLTTEKEICHLLIFRWTLCRAGFSVGSITSRCFEKWTNTQSRNHGWTREVSHC